MQMRERADNNCSKKVNDELLISWLLQKLAYQNIHCYPAGQDFYTNTSSGENSTEISPKFRFDCFDASCSSQ